jgi:cytochrome b561
VLVHSLPDYAALLLTPRPLGVPILVGVLAGVDNGFPHRAPPLPPTVGTLERKIVVLSEVSLYALLLLQPLIGWAMLSAAGGPIVVFGSIRLPRIAPFDAQLFWLLRQAHSVVAYTLMAAIAAHISAILLHTLTLRDRMIERMTFRFRPKDDRTRLG